MLEVAPISDHEMTYEEAVLYCAFLDYNGHRDWRLPDRAEYMDVIGISGWYVCRSSEWVSKWKVCPVRDV
jgi:hypothetical protein